MLGAGPGGYVAAIRAAQLGLKVACVERRATLGGTCLNVGCIPSKAMLQSSENFEDVRKHFADHGINVTGVTLDLAQMQKRKAEVVSANVKGIEFLFKKNGVTWLRGDGPPQQARPGHRRRQDLHRQEHHHRHRQREHPSLPASRSMRSASSPPPAPSSSSRSPATSS